jgi:O-antigen/teichoic acid export membrane protein
MPSPHASPVPAASLFKNVARASGAYSLPFILQRLAGVFLLPITTRYLTRSDFAIVDLLDQALTVLALLLGVRFAAALGYFYFQADSPPARQRVASTAIFGAAIIGTTAAAAIWPCAAELSRLVFGNPSAARYIHIALFTWPIGFAMEALFSLLRVENRTAMYNLASAIRLVLSLAAIVALVALLKLRVAGMLYSGLIAGGLTLLFMGTEALRRMRPAFDFRIFARMARFAMPLGVGGIATLIINFGDRFFLPHYRPLADLGIYVLAYKVGMLIAFVYGSFDAHWSAQVFQIMRREDSDRVFARMFTYVVLGLSSAGLALVVCARPILRIMVAPAFQDAAALVPVIVLAYFIRALGDFLRSLFLVAGRTGYDAITNWFGALVCLASYWMLIPRFGIWGAAFATVIAFAVIAVVSAVWAYRVQRYRIEAGRLAKVGAALTVAILPCFVLPASSLLAQIGVAAGSLAIFPAALWILRFATPGELQDGRAAVQATVRRLYAASRRAIARS